MTYIHIYPHLSIGHVSRQIDISSWCTTYNFEKKMHLYKTDFVHHLWIEITNVDRTLTGRRYIDFLVNQLLLLLKNIRLGTQENVY